MTEINDAPDAVIEREDVLDEDNRLTDEFVRSVSEAVENNNSALAQELVNPLHNADIADLFELIDADERAPLADALGDLVSADVLAEMNEHVREDVIEALDAGQIAGLTEQLDTDDAVAIIEDLDKGEQQAVLAELDAEAQRDEMALDAEIAANQNALEAAGHWGVPTLVFAGEPFFGQDRIEMVRWRMEQKGIEAR